jgi:hypothetical protein
MRRRKNNIDLGLDLRVAIKRVSASYETVLSLDPLVEDEALLRAHRNHIQLCRAALGHLEALIRLARATHQADAREVNEAERLLTEAREALAAAPLPDEAAHEE